MRRVLAALIALVVAAVLPVVAAPTVHAADPPVQPLGQTTITGVAQVGQTLTAHSAGWPVPGTSTFKWSTIPASNLTATGATYTVPQGAVEKQILVTETFTRSGAENSVSTATSATIMPGPTPQATTPTTIKGAVRVGETLTVVPARWPARGTAKVSWTVGGVLVGVAGAYEVQAADVGKPLKVTETWTDPGYEDGAMSASAVVTVAPGAAPSPAPRPRVDGDLRVGSTLTATPASWPIAGTSTFTWTADGKTVGTGRSYTVTPATVGQKLVYTETLTHPAYDASPAIVELGFVEKVPVALAVGVGKVRKGKRAAVRVRIAPEYSGLTASNGVTVRYAGRKVTVPALKQGRLVVKLPAKRKGQYWLTVSYAGSAVFGKASRTLAVRVR